MSDVSPAVFVAKNIAERTVNEKTVTLKTGDIVKILPVSATLIDEVVAGVLDPEVPMWFNEDKQRNEPNPSDPKYLKEMQQAERKRGVAAMDAMVMFGVEMITPIPDKSVWLTKLQKLEKMGRINLSAYDLNDPIDVEFLYKRFIISDTNLLNEISKVSGIITEDVERAERSFPSN